MPQTFSLSDNPKWQDLVVSYVRKSVPRGRGQVALENSRRQHRFSREMMSVKRLQKFHTDDVSAPKSGWRLWLVEANFPCSTTNRSTTQTSSEWNFCARSSDVNYREHQCGVANCRLFSQAGGGGPDKFLPLWGLSKNLCIRDAPEYCLLKYMYLQFAFNYRRLVYFTPLYVT